MARPDRWPVVVAGAATALMVALTVYGIGDKSLWYDEAYSVGLVDRSLGDALWRITHWELNQSPYYVLLLGWHELGDGEGFLRSLSAIFAVAAVPVVYVLGRRLADPWTGAIAAVVVAGHGLVVQWGQQVRGYTLATVAVAVATLLLVDAIERPSTGRSVAYGAVAAITAYSHLVAGLVIATHALSLLALRPVPWRFIRVAGATAALLAAPLAWYLVTREGDPLSYINAPNTRELGGTFADVAGGGPLNLVVVGVLAAIGAFVTLTRAHRASWGSVEAWRSALPAACFVLPIVAVVVSTYTVKPLLVPRFLIVMVPALAVLVAAGVRRLPRPASAVALLALAGASAVAVGDWYGIENEENWRGAVTHVAGSVAPGDDVVVVPGRAVHAVRYYAPDLRTVSPTAVEDIAGDRLWVLQRRTLQPVPVPDELAAMLDREFELVDERGFWNVGVLLYERTP